MAYKSKRCSYHTNLRMNDETYTMRREVMKILYEAKKLLGGDMPRVDIRITKINNPDMADILGTARMNDCMIWIPAKTIKTMYLREVVYHELLHAVYGTDHDDDCPLMAARRSEYPLDKDQCERLFLQWTK